MEEDLHHHIEQVLFTQLEKQLFHIKSTQKHESKRFERLNSQLQLTRHQLEIYSDEAKQIQEALTGCVESFTKENWTSLRSIKTPVSLLSDVCDKVLLLLDIKDRSWKSFRSVSKNFFAFKNLMISVQNEQISDDIINEVLSIWKNQSTIRLKLSKVSPGACILVDWVGLIVEYNVKNEIIISSKKRIPELERMIKHQSKTLSELNSESLDLEELMNKTKGNMDDQELDCEDCSELSLTSKPYSFIRNQHDERVILHSTVHRGTASGGILNSSQFSQKKIELKAVFPNFNSDNLYGEMPVDNNETPDDQIVFEGKNEMIGCCRMKFLCF